MKTLNPLCQVPTLALENDEIMTETAAIALMVLDRRPDLAPPVGRAERQLFQRLLVWLVANVYPTFTFADYPERWAPDAPEQLKKNVIEYRKSLYIWLNSQLTAEPYAFGEQLTLVDCYLCTMRTWGPGHEWFQDNATNISAIADAVCQLPKLQEVLKGMKLFEWDTRRLCYLLFSNFIHNDGRN